MVGVEHVAPDAEPGLRLARPHDRPVGECRSGQELDHERIVVHLEVAPVRQFVHPLVAHGTKVNALLELAPVVAPDDERAARPPNDVHERRLVDHEVVHPKPAASRAPHAGVEHDLLGVEAVDDDVVLRPVLRRLDAKILEIERAPGIAADAEEATRQMTSRIDRIMDS